MSETNKTDTRTVSERVAAWATGEFVGASSKVMARLVLGEAAGEDAPNSYPRDAADFNRCLLLIDEVPEIRQHFPELRALSHEWDVLIEYWPVLGLVFVEECGWNWCKGTKADYTYTIMRHLFGLAAVRRIVADKGLDINELIDLRPPKSFRAAADRIDEYLAAEKSDADASDVDSRLATVENNVDNLVETVKSMSELLNRLVRHLENQ